MTSRREEDERVMEILAAARRKPAAEREAYLQSACAGDEDLRREVADALSWEERMGGFLQQPVAMIADGNPDSAVTGAVQFAAGLEIGQYRIESKLGEGGMSSVWLALDTRLGRRVAIKFLSDDLADAEARRRFQREAQMASSLNHPHIVTVYDTGEFERRQYLVTEYVDGGTLKDWIKEKRRTAKEIAELLTGVADGLAAAHQAGILHRDIKPMNILVARNGYAKLADFGLAKLAEDGRIDLAARLPEGRTRPGLILGTIAYMSPEQASGQPLDSRSDIFSFGVVLYEMFSGKRPFGGGTDLEVLKTIIHGELPPLSEEVPEAYRNVVEKALEKSPTERYQSMREMVVDLRRGQRSQRLTAPPSLTPRPGDAVAGVEEAIVPVEGGVSSPGQLAEELSPAPPKSKSGSTSDKVWLKIGVGIFAIAVVALAAVGAYRWPRPPVQRALTRLTFDEGLQTGATWSPDGRFIAYASDRGGKFDIWVQQVSGGDPIQITKRPGQNIQPAWSPDGKDIAYRSEEGDGGIYVIPALGGAGLERKIAPFGYYPQWSPDSSQVLFRTHFTAIGYSNRFYVARLDGSPPREVLSEFIAQNNLWATSAAWHPDGKRITVWVGSSSPTPVFWTVPLSGGPGIELEISPAVQKELAEASGDTKASTQLGEYRFCWSPLGNAIYFVRGYRGVRNIWKLTVDPGTLRANGIDRLTTGPGPESALAVSPDGKRLAFTAGSQRIQTWLFPFDAKTGQMKGSGNAITSPGRTSISPQLSPDGTKVGYTVPHGESYGRAFGDVRNEVWVKLLVDGSEVPIPSDGYSSWDPMWSPDSVHLVYERRNLRTNDRQLMLWSSQSHEEEPLPGVTEQGLVIDWSRDSKWLLMYTPTGLWLIPFPPSPHAETAARKIASDPAYQLYQPHLSPDDRWIVFEAAANSPNPESTLYVVPASGGPWTRITDGRHWDDKPRWSPDGRTIYFISGPGGFFNVWGIHFDQATGKPVGQPFQVTKFDSPRLMIPRFIPPVGLSLNRDKLVLTMEQESGNIWVLDNVDP